MKCSISKQRFSPSARCRSGAEQPESAINAIVTSNPSAGSAYGIDSVRHGPDCPHCQAITASRAARESAVIASDEGNHTRDSGPGDPVDEVRISAAALEAAEGVTVASKAPPDPGGRRATLIDVYA